MIEGGRRAATTHLATAPTAPMESRARPHEATTVTTTVGQQVSDNRVTGHHAWDRVCDHPNGQTQPTDRNRNAGRVEWSSRAAECRTEQPCLAECRTEQPNRSEHSAQWSRVEPSGAEWTSNKTAIGQRRLEQKDERRINDPN